VPRKLTKEELIRAIRLNITAEHEAVHLYMAHADATDDPIAKKVLIDVANEERVHIGEFQKLLSILAPDEDTFVGDGVREVEEMQAELSVVGGPQEELVAQEGMPMELAVETGGPTEETSAAASENDTSSSGNTIGVRTIGSLID
jgi:rubrerythrin